MSKDEKVIPITRGRPARKSRDVGVPDLFLLPPPEISQAITVRIVGGRSTERRNTTVPNFFIGKDHKICRSEESDVVLDTAVRFSTLDEFRRVASELALSQLVAMWNELAGVRTISRFENRTIAVDRIWRALMRPDEPMPDRQHRVKRKRVRRKRQPKAELILTLLRRPEGATLEEIRKVTDWQAHSVRGFISGKVSKALGYPVQSFRRDGQRVYVISETPRNGSTEVSLLDHPTAE